MKDTEAYTPEFQQFLDDEDTHGVVSFRVLYRWMTDDTTAALMLSQIVYWHRRSTKTQASKVQVMRDGKRWLVKKRTDWRLEIGMTPREADTAIDRLVKIGLIEKEVHFFQGTLQTYIHINQAAFVEISRNAAAQMLREVEAEADAETASTIKTNSPNRKLQKSNLHIRELPINESVNYSPTNLQIRENITEITKTETTESEITTRVAANAAAPALPPKPIKAKAEPKKTTPERSEKQQRQDRIMAEMILDCTGSTFEEFKDRMGSAFDKALGAYRPYVKNIDDVGDPEPWAIMAERFRPGGWWYTDTNATANFSGQQGRRPTPAGIWKAWKAWEIMQPGPRLAISGNGRNHSPPSVDANGQPVPAMWDTIRQMREKRGAT